MVVVYNTKTPDMETVEALAAQAIAQADKAGITLNSEPDSESTHIGGFEYSGGALFAGAPEASAAPSHKFDGPKI